MSVVTSTAVTFADALDRIRAVYQPIVHFDSNEIIGYEALARGPRGTAFESPAALFGAAHAENRVAELDSVCRLAALRGATQARLRRPTALFVNVEPALAGAAIGAGGMSELSRARSGFDVFFEITERELADRPAELLDIVERMRAAGVGIALDDVGADRRSLALLPLLRPDVVKLDMSLIHAHPSHRSGEVMNGVCAYAEHTGAVILAEGVETEAHLMAARSMGASLAQGWFFGRPGELPGTPPPLHPAVTLGLTPRVVPTSPFELLGPDDTVRIGRKDVLLSVTRALESQAVGLGEHAVVATAFQRARHFTPATRRRYVQLAEHAALVVGLGVGMAGEPAPGVLGADLSDDDALVGEWDIAVLGPHYAGALIARDLGDTGPDRERRFAYRLTFDRDRVVEVAACLIGRVSRSSSV